jgi:hypothetical protein
MEIVTLASVFVALVSLAIAASKRNQFNKLERALHIQHRIQGTPVPALVRVYAPARRT